MSHSPSSRSAVLALWLGYVGFVIYGSLVPLDFRPLPLDKAWGLFQQTRMFNLGIESRADWIANGVLYVPVGFLTAWLFGSPSMHSNSVMAFRTGRLILAGLFCVSLALAVEFSQLFFPPRTVSLNDLLAEVIGSGIGLIAASLSPGWIGKLLHAHRFDTSRLFWHIVEVFLVAYVAYSLFPYDVLVSLDELTQKIRGGNWGWWLAGESPLSLHDCFKLCAEVMLTLPFGIYLGYRLAANHDESNRPDGIRHSEPGPESSDALLDSGFRWKDVAPRGSRYTSQIVLAAALGAFLGFVLELAQFFTATGVSQGLSIITRLAGTSAGFVLWQRRAAFTPDRIAILLRRYALPLSALYLAMLILANGWFSFRWRDIEFAALQLAETKFLPFYYHYYTTEASALFSLASALLMYLPVGIMTWANRGAPASALWLSAVLALIVEAGKLFLQGIHPDPTNILLAGCSAWFGAIGPQWLTDAANRGKNVTADYPSARAAMRRNDDSAPDQPPVGDVPAGQIFPSGGSGASENKFAFLAMLAVLAICAYRAWTFPAIPAILVALLATCALTVWRHPTRAFFLIPLALPILDLAPWSGRFYFDEFDLLVLTCLAVGYARVPALARPALGDPALFACLTLVAASLLVSTAIALWPWQAPGENAFTNYFSPYNALRIGKGALWAFLAIGLMRRMQAHGLNVIRPWAQGMTGGLALTVAVIIWERITFSSLFDFASDYRVTGPISAMHVGGAYIECFLAAAAPFLLLLMLQTQSWTNRVIGLCLLLATTYALMVTYSRGGYAAFAISIGLFLFFAVVGLRQTNRNGLLAGLLILLAISAAVPVLTGQFAQQRLARIAQDFDTRKTHWRDVLDLRTPDLTTSLFGMGLGRFPETRYVLGSEKARTGSYQLRTENGNTYLRLTAGRPLYIEQIVPVEPRKRYTLKLNVRSPVSGTIGLSLCEKWQLTSFECRWINIAIPAAGDDWSRIELPVDTLHLRPSPWYARKPVKLSLHTPGGISRQVDFDNIRLEPKNGGSLLQNGDFESLMDHWFFASDNHLEWHAHSLAVTVLFDLGWIGILAFVAFFATMLRPLVTRSWSGSLNAAAICAALISFSIVGLFDTLIDAPRFLFLLAILGPITNTACETTSCRRSA